MTVSPEERARLDREYNARAMTAPYDVDGIYAARSRAALERVERIADLVYDERSGSKLDLYPAGKGSPLFVWIHGGYWRAQSKDGNAFVAPGLVAQGISVASLDYALAPAVTLDEIVRQVRVAVAWLQRHAPDHGIDVRRLHVGGHSAGGHLTGMLLAGGWHGAFGVRPDLIATALPVSGLFDLHPLRATFVQDFLSLDEAAASFNSPIEHLPSTSSATLIAAAGGIESGEFRRQTADYVRAWTGRGLAGREVAMPGFHHFDIILELEQPGNPLFDALHAAIRG
jgi:arylformamidase